MKTTTIALVSCALAAGLLTTAPATASSAVAVPTVLPANLPLSKALVRFGQANGWNIEWQLPEDYALEADMRLPGKGVIADVQFLIRTFQGRHALQGVGILVNSEERNIKVLRKGGDERPRDTALELRLSTGVLTADNLVSNRPQPLAPMQVSVGLGPAPAPLRPVMPSSRVVPDRMPPIQLPTRDVRAAAALEAARQADRDLAQRTVAMWERSVAEQASADANDISHLLPPPALVRGTPSTGSAGALALAAGEISAPIPEIAPPTSVLPETPGVGAVTERRSHPEVVASSLQVAQPTTPALTPPRQAPASAKASGAALIEQGATTVPPVKAQVPDRTWLAHNGDTLKDTISNWAKQQNWVLVWNDKRPDLEVVGNVEVEGDLVDAVTYLFDIYRRSGAKFAVDVYTKQQLILVKEQ